MIKTYKMILISLIAGIILTVLTMPIGAGSRDVWGQPYPIFQHAEVSNNKDFSCPRYVDCTPAAIEYEYRFNILGAVLDVFIWSGLSFVAITIFTKFNKTSSVTSKTTKRSNH